jgi:hypothetical protein
VTPIRRTLVLVALAFGLSVGCVPQGPNLAPWLYLDPDPSTAPEQRHVVVIGDSLTAWAETDAKIAWAATGDAISYQAFGGTQWQHWMKRFEKIPAGSTVEVLLGTNDIGNLTLHQAEWNALAGLEVLATRQPACVVTFLLNTTSASYRPPEIRAKVAGYNAWLVELVESGRYPWLGLYDWRADSAGHPEYLLLPGDPVHHTDDDNPATMDGNQAYIEAQLRAPSACPATPALPG